MASIRNNPGFNRTLERVHDKKAEGAAELIIDVRDRATPKGFKVGMSTKKYISLPTLQKPQQQGIYKTCLKNQGVPISAFASGRS